MRIYTRGGDKGTTSLVGGARVSKAAPEIAACGAVDELSSILGLVIALGVGSEQQQVLQELQNRLFELGAELAADGGKTAPRITEADVVYLEKLIDHYSALVPPLKTFINPGGAPPAAALHLARTIARRAERCIVALAAAKQIQPNVLCFANRVSDLLFVMARYVNHTAGVAENAWHPRQ